MSELGIFETIFSTRSLRRLKPDPVPDAMIHKILDAAIRAPSGGNNQNWRFLVVKSPEVKKQIQDVYLKGWRDVQGMYKSRKAPEHLGEERLGRILDAATYLAEHMSEVPVLLVACLKAPPMPADIAARLGRLSGSSIYPAVQNVLLSCRALGLGATLTTVASLYDEELQAVLGLPKDVSTYALIPIGYPRGKFGPVQRMSVEEVTCVDRWGQAFTGK
jgi:nitroreductase